MRNIFLAVMLIVLTACEHKEFCYDHPHTISVNVTFDWEYAPEATPTGMCVYFYSLENGNYKRFDFDNIQGGEVDLRVGKYRVLSYNNDTESVKFLNTDSFDKHCANTREGNALEPILGHSASYAPKASGADEERVVISPDMMWGCSVSEIEVVDSGEQNIILYPQELVCRYTYEVHNVKNMQYMQQMSGTISGMSGMLTFSSEALDDEAVTIPFESVKVDDSTIKGGFYTFGHHEGNAEPHKMVFYAIMNDGTKYCFRDSEQLDVTEQVDNAQDKRRVHIIIDGLDLPEPIVSGEGFNPSLDDWIVEDNEIIV